MSHTTQTITTAFLPLALILALTACSPTDQATTATSDNRTTAAGKDQQADSDYPYAFEKVADNTWVMHGPLELPNPENKGFMNNPGIVITSAGLVMIDPGSTIHVGKHVLQEIKEVSDLPVVAVFNTHIHGDHWLANQAIKDAYSEVKIYGHPKMIAAADDGEGDNWVALMDTMTKGASTGTQVVAPGNAVDDTDIITIGDTRFKIYHNGVAHTKTDIMIEVLDNSVVFLGDNVLAKRLPRMSDGTFTGSLDAIDRILMSNAKTYVPGHGPSGDVAMVNEYRNYISLVYDAAKKSFEEDLDSSDVINITRATTVAYKDWSGYEEQLGQHGAQAYAEVEAAEF